MKRFYSKVAKKITITLRDKLLVNEESSNVVFVSEDGVNKKVILDRQFKSLLLSGIDFQRVIVESVVIEKDGMTSEDMAKFTASLDKAILDIQNISNASDANMLVVKRHIILAMATLIYFMGCLFFMWYFK